MALQQKFGDPENRQMEIDSYNVENDTTRSNEEEFPSKLAPVYLLILIPSIGELVENTMI